MSSRKLMVPTIAAAAIPAAHNPAIAASGATACGTSAKRGASRRAQSRSPHSQNAAITALMGRPGRTAVDETSGARSRRFDLAEPLNIVHPLSQERGRFAPAFVRLCDGWPYWDNNNLKRVGLI